MKTKSGLSPSVQTKGGLFLAQQTPLLLFGMTAQKSKNRSRNQDVLRWCSNFLNYVSLNNYQKAIQLALAMEQPGRLLSLFRSLQIQDFEPNSVTGRVSVDEVIRNIAGSDLVKLLRYSRDWNTNAKTSKVAQQLLYAIVKLKSADEIMKSFKDDQREAAFMQGFHENGQLTATALKDLINALLPYTERHLSRINRLVQDSYIIDYILGEMDDGLLDIGTDVDTQIL